MNFFDDIDIYADRIAVDADDGRTIDYKTLISDGNRITADVPSRSITFLVCENCYESIAAYVAFLRKKIVVALINPKIDEQMFGYLLKSYKPEYIFCNKSWHADGEQIVELNEYHLLKTQNKDNSVVNPELAVLITTSGSTGSPKLVMQSYKNITANANSIAEYLDITSDDRAITTMPMSYTYGLSIIQSHLLKGARIIATEKTLMDREFWTLFKEKETTTFGGVPYTYEILKRLRFGRMELPSLKYITQAGGRLPKEMALEFSEICSNKGIKMIIMYGQTEATARMSYLPWEYAISKAGSIGKAIPGGTLKLIDVNGHEITEPDITGEMIYSGDNVTLGYAQCRDDLANDDERHGVLETGDMAKCDEDGFFYVVGRKKRFLKLFGNRVNLDEAESILSSAGFKCVCGGRDDKLKIYLVADDGDKLKEAVDYISAKIGINRSGFEATLIREIPRNEAGKVLYSKLEELYG